MQVQNSLAEVRVLLLIEERKNELLLAEHLAVFELISLSRQNIATADVTEEDFDLVILDLDTLNSYSSQLAIWRQSVAPLLLPVLVLMPTREAKNLSIELRQHVDALVYEPINSVDLDIATTTLTQARRLSYELLQQCQKLERIAESKSQFTSAVAHEFRNPLSIISSLTQLLTRNGDGMSTERRNKMLARTQAAVERLTKLVDDLLVFNRNAALRSRFNPKKVDLEKRCQAVLEDFQLINKGMYEISFDIRGDCSDIFVDPALISTILTNLLTNALKYSPDDSPVSLVLDRQAEQIVIEVRDNGQGIPTEDQASLFDAFFRARNVGTIEGTGLGLNIVKQCVELHNGVIELQSEVGRGTTFTVFLPLDSLKSPKQSWLLSMAIPLSNRRKEVSADAEDR